MDLALSYSLCLYVLRLSESDSLFSRMADGLDVWVPILPHARGFLEWPLACLLSAGEQLLAPLAGMGDAENPL